MKAGERVGAGVSGGADSVALLCLLLGLRNELGIILSVVHFNHKLRAAESEDDEQFVAALAARHNLEFHRESGDVLAHAEQKRLSIETAAREMRYAYFWQLLKDSKLDRIATGHTLDDQAETVILRIARGSGTRGLAGIYPQVMSVPGVQSSAEHSIVRPLLGIRRKELEDYLCGPGQPWREDSSNRDLHYARNRIRHEILPHLESNLNPSIRETLADTAEIARAEEEYWQAQIAAILQLAWSGDVLRVSSVAGLPLALQRRIVRAGSEALRLRLEFAHVDQILQVIDGQSASLVLPNGWLASRSGNEVRFERPTSPGSLDYEYPLPIPGRTEVPQAGTALETMLLQAASGYNRDQLLNPELLQSELRVRNWRAGDRFWPAHTKEPRKIKELLQKRHLTGTQRKLWPVVVSGGDIVWVRGFPCPERFRGNSEQALLIHEVPLFKP